MIYYIPNVDRRQLVDDRLEAEFPELTDVKKRVVPTINALKEKLYIFDLGLNDMAVELTKLAVAELVTKVKSLMYLRAIFLLMMRRQTLLALSSS